jgi:hypothetical protein
MGNFAITTSGFNSNSYCQAVSNTKLDMDINSMISCKSLSEAMSFLKIQNFIFTL